MNSRQRAYLGSLANNIDPIFQIGKASLSKFEVAGCIFDAILKNIKA